jgi:hypothetical protein
MHLETLNEQPASILGLAGSQGMDTSCAVVAFEAGVNYFFFYDVSHENLLNGLKPMFPMAQQAKIPVVAFTCTRWGQLLRGHPDWLGKIPTAADCYRYALHQKAVHLALTAPQTQAQLQENLSVLHASELTPEAVLRWQDYGALVYGDGKDAFETRWL